MNERIQELADKAIEDMPGAWNIPDEFCEKFAELVVRECASELIRWKDEPFPYDPEFGAKLIKRHFGVKNEQTTD